MVILKQTTNVWRPTSGASLQKSNINGLQWLPLAEWWYNTNYHATTKLNPYEAVYDQLPPSPTSYIPGCSKVQIVDQLL